MKKTYFTPVFLTSVSDTSDHIDMTKSQEGATGTGFTSESFNDLLSGLGITTGKLAEIFGDSWESVLQGMGFNPDDPSTYYILEEYLLDNNWV